MLNFFSKFKQKKSINKELPYLYNAIILTGISCYFEKHGVDASQALNVIVKSTIIPENIFFISGLEKDDYETLITNHLPLFIHNALVSDSFPMREQIKEIAKSLNQSIESSKENPWAKILINHGSQGLSPNPDEWEVSLSPLDKAALSMARPMWEKATTELLDKAKDILLRERDLLELWLIQKNSEFSSARANA